MPQEALRAGAGRLLRSAARALLNSRPQMGWPFSASVSWKVGSRAKAMSKCWRQGLRRPSTQWLNAMYFSALTWLLMGSSCAVDRGVSAKDQVSLNKEFVELGKEIDRSEEHTSELQSPDHLVCRLLLEKKKHTTRPPPPATPAPPLLLTTLDTNCTTAWWRRN